MAGGDYGLPQGAGPQSSRFDSLHPDLTPAELREGIDMLIAHFGKDGARRFIDTVVRARMKQLAFNGTAGAVDLARQHAPAVAATVQHLRTWAATNPIVLAGVFGSASAAALSFLQHRKQSPPPA